MTLQCYEIIQGGLINLGKDDKIRFKMKKF